MSKCQDLKRRIQEVEEYNETTAVSIARTKRAIQRLRLERAFLLEKLEERTSVKVEDSDGTVSAPGSPVAETHTKEKRRKAAPRDPDLPKRPQNPYIIFCEREKERVKADLDATRPGENVDLTKAMAEAWKELGSAGRKPFQALYEEDRKRYLREMAAWESPTATEAGLKEKRRAQKALREMALAESEKKEGDADAEGDVTLDPDALKDEEISDMDEDDDGPETSRVVATSPPPEPAPAEPAPVAQASTPAPAPVEPPAQSSPAAPQSSPPAQQIPPMQAPPLVPASSFPPVQSSEPGQAPGPVLPPPNNYQSPQ